MNRACQFADFLIRQARGRRPATVASRILSRAARKAEPHYEHLRARLPFGFKTQREVRPDFKIGLAVLAHERPEYLEICLDSLFQTRLYDYDIVFLLQDDGSKDPRVREIIERPRPAPYKIVRSFTPKGHNSWGAAFNKAMRALREIDDFDIVGSSDADALFHPEWLHQTLRIALWAKKYHRRHILGPFSSFNSSDFQFHGVLGVYASPYGDYVVKRRMGALNYFFFREDFERTGFFPEDKDDETLMTKKFETLRLRSFSTETSYVDHLGQDSVLNRWRPVPVARAVCGMRLAKGPWPRDPETVVPRSLDFYKHGKENLSLRPMTSSSLKLDVLIPVIERDAETLPLVVEGLRKHLRHPLGRIFVVAPPSRLIEGFCAANDCDFAPEDSVLPFGKEDIDYTAGGWDRAGWLFQQFLKYAGDSICSQSHYLAFDADTVLVRPQVFEVKGKIVLLHSDEYHPPYFAVYEKLLGEPAPIGLSFVSHHMVFAKERIAELRARIESRFPGMTWHEAICRAIDKTEPSAFSEYETYGQWMTRNHPEEILREYWFNLTLPRDQAQGMRLSQLETLGDFRSVSMHRHYT